MATHQTRKRPHPADGERSYRMISTPPPVLPPSRVSRASRSAWSLAGEIGMSKSWLYAHCDSEQELQLATVGAAEDVFTAEVIAPVAGGPGGAANASTPCARGTCPTSSAASSPAAASSPPPPPSGTRRRGPIRDRVRTVLAGWTQLLEANVRAGQQRGDLARDIAIGQLVFELNALLHEANGHYLLFRDTAALDRARTAIDNRLTGAQH